MRSRRAHRRSTKTNTLKRVRSRIKVHAHHHRRYAGIRGGSRGPKVARPRRAKAAKPATGTHRHLKHPRRRGYHLKHPRKKRAPGALLRKTVHRRKGYHVHRKKGYHLKHPRKRGYHIHRRKGLHHPHKGSHVHRHRRLGLKHPHKGYHGHRHFYGRKKKKAAPAQPAQTISAASYLSMF